MKLTLGEGIIVGVLLPLVIYFLELLDLLHTVSLIFLLVGLWTIVFGLTLAKPADRLYYGSWGAVIAVISTSFIFPIEYSIAAILVVIIVAIFVSATIRSRKSKNVIV